MANVTRFNPFGELLGELNRGFWVRPFDFEEEAPLKMKVDVTEDDKAFTVRADVPGVNKDDIKVEVEGGSVSISAEVKKDKEDKKDEKVVRRERYYGMVSRSFTLPSDVDSTASKAEYKDGVLKLTLPKKANGSAKRISVA